MHEIKKLENLQTQGESGPVAAMGILMPSNSAARPKENCRSAKIRALKGIRIRRLAATEEAFRARALNSKT